MFPKMYQPIKRRCGWGSRLLYQRSWVRTPGKAWMPILSVLDPPKCMVGLKTGLPSNLVHGKCQVHSPVTLVDLVVAVFSETRVNMGDIPLERSPRRAFHPLALVSRERVGLKPYNQPTNQPMLNEVLMHVHRLLVHR